MPESESLEHIAGEGTMKRATWVDGVGSSASSRSSLRSVGGVCGLSVGGGGSAEQSPATSEKGVVDCKSHATTARNGSQRRLPRGRRNQVHRPERAERCEREESAEREENAKRRAKSEEGKGQREKGDTSGSRL